MGVLLSLCRIFSEHDFSKNTSGRLLLRYRCKDRKKRESRNQQKGLYSSRERERERDKFQKVDGFQKKLIWGTIYDFYENKAAPTIDVLHKKLKEISTGMHYEFPYGRTTLYHLQKKRGFKYQKADNHKVLMETPRIVSWRWKYLRQIEKYLSEGYLILYN